MRLTLLTLSAAAMLAMTACSDLVSLNSFAPDNLVVQNAALPGVWADNDNLYVIQIRDRGYSITVTPNGKNGDTLRLEAKLFRAGTAEILDVVPAGDDDPFHLPTHTPVRIWVDERTLKFAYLDSKWLREHARQNLAVQDVGKRLLITAPGVALMRFLLLNAADDRAYEDTPAELKRQ